MVPTFPLIVLGLENTGIVHDGPSSDTTTTVVVAEPERVFLVQVIEKVVVVLKLTTIDPDVDVAEVQGAEHAVALVEDQVRVELPPEVMV